MNDAADASAPAPEDRARIARSRRLQEALDSLAFEREREAALLGRLEPVVRDAEAWRVDAAALERMTPEHGEYLRAIGFAQPRPPDDAMGRFETRIGEIQAQLDDCRRKQRALEAYARALEESSS